VTAWMSRAEGGDLFDAFVAQSVVAIGGNPELTDLSRHRSRADIEVELARLHPGERPRSLAVGAAQLWRFHHEMTDGDLVVTYDPRRRLYAVGRIASPYRYDPDLGARLGVDEEGYGHHRRVAWMAQRVPRDQLSATARNTLGATLTLFRLPEPVEAEVLHLATLQPTPDPGRGLPVPAHPEARSESDADAFGLPELEVRGRERIKDMVARLSWDEMQRLVAGVLRAMGYKTRISAPGADRGRDILASPDGLGFEDPRIAVEVKHRPKEQIGAPALRSFIGGRHEGEKGLYVSTGGFSGEARYEADRAKIPLTLLTLEELVDLLVTHYDRADDETRQLVPLRRLYWPLDV